MNKKIVFILVAVLLVSTFFIVQAAPPMPGAIFTTTEDGTIVNENTRYGSKQDVYLDGGPGPNAPPNAAGLPEGDYYFQVTDPSGKVLLSSDEISCRQFHVNGNGVIDEVLGESSCKHKQGNDVDHNAKTVQLYPYDDTPNRGGEYKVWATMVKDYDEKNGDNYSPGNVYGFIDSKSKTDNYKVRKERVPTIIEIDVDKTADPTQVNEPGGMVTFTVKVRNDSPVEVTLNSLDDSIYGDLNGKGNCSVPQTLGPGGSYECSFNAKIEGNAGDSETDVITACAADEDDNQDCDKDDAKVIIVDKLPEIKVVKSADPTEVKEPGGNVKFTVVVYNESNAQDPLILKQLVDDIHGDLNGQGDCSVPQTIQPGESYSCSFTALVQGKEGDSETDTVKGCGVDDEDNEVCDEDKAKVTIINGALPVIEVIKTVDPEVKEVPGGVFTFTVEIKNLSDPNDPVTITSLVDNIHGNLNGKGSCSVPQTIQPGASYKCTFSVEITNKPEGYSETDTVTAEGTDDEGNPVKDSDDATIRIIGGPPPIVCEQTVGELTVGYEDVPLKSLIDYDFNDWITDITANLKYVDQVECLLSSISFKFEPEARGAQNNHAFHMRFLAKDFKSSGQATLVIRDQNGNLISTTNHAFTAGQDNDYTIFPKTSQVFDDLVNTIEAQRPMKSPQRTAELTISFTTPFQFTLDDYNLENPHGVNLFFDPWLDVFTNTVPPVPITKVHAGDTTILTIPRIGWKWPEESVPVYGSYNSVKSDLVFPPNWYLPANANNCVYDGVPCTAWP